MNTCNYKINIIDMACHQMAISVQALHDRQVVHGDISLNNYMVRLNNEYIPLDYNIVLTDFE